MSSVELTPKLKELLNSAEAEQDAGADLCREAEAEEEEKCPREGGGGGREVKKC